MGDVTESTEPIYPTGGIVHSQEVPRMPQILGVGMHEFGKFPDKSYTDLAEVAIREALADAGMSWSEMDALFHGNALGGPLTGSNITNRMGANGAPIYNLEAYCVSSLVALNQAYSFVASGQYDAVVVAGTEVQPRGYIPSPGDPEWVQRTGMAVLPAKGDSQLAQRYMELHGLEPEHMAKVGVKSKKNAALSPYSHYQNPDITVADVLDSPMVTTPIHLYEMSPPSDGGAAVVVCSDEVAADAGGDDAVTIETVVQGTPTYEESRYPHPYSPLRERCTNRAYEETGRGPEDVDLAQLHDPTAFTEINAYENAGFAEEGQGHRLLEENETTLDGSIPVNTDGGMLSRGNAPGALGLASVAETVWQLRGEAGERQVDGAECGLITIGGYGPHVVSSVLSA